MITRRMIWVMCIFVVLVGIVGTAAAADDPIWKEAGIAPVCKQVDSTDSPYVIQCSDSDIVAARIKEVNVRCTADWDATHFTLAVIDIDTLNADLQKWDGGALYWSVIDAEGNVARGEFHR